ncbi:MAG TPA: amino acid adenylation domain-containing protein, partial [Gammaproteobacteria bacterium]|nr:amino acid adenylation domain-containing protein [Gammaproteobacteria bacterium]
MQRTYIAHNSLLPFYLAWQLAPNNCDYNLSFSYQFENNVDIDLFIMKLKELVKLKCYLRQTFTIKEEKLIACIHDDLPPEVNFYSSSLPEFAKLEQEIVKKPHYLNNQSAIKCNIIHLDDSGKNVIIFNIHHIILDGNSLSRFMHDLNQLLANEAVIQEEAESYIARVEKEPTLQAEDKNNIFIAYTEKINEIVQNITYPAINNRHVVLHYTDVLPNVIRKQLMLFSKAYNISPFNLLLLAWAIFESKIFNQKYALINYLVNVCMDKTISGCFVNLIAFPLIVTEQDTYLSLVHAWHDEIAILKRASKIKWDNKSHQHTISGFAHSGFACLPDLVIDGLHYVPKSYPQIANANLNIKYCQQENEIFFDCAIVAGMFPEYFTGNLLARFFNYLNKLLNDARTPLIDSGITFSLEKQQILYDFNNTDTVNLSNMTIHRLFEENAMTTPTAIAVTFEGERITYGELNEKSNQLARYIRKKYQVLMQQELQPDTLIPICVERSLAMIIGLLGILKAGGAYIPLDPRYPSRRIKFILEDIDCKFILLQSYSKLKLEKINKNIKQIVLDEISCQKESNRNLSIYNESNKLAYVMYTSGTTGTPKGVMVEHRNVVSLVKNVNYFNVNQSDAFILLSDIAFDAATFEIWGALLNGVKLFIPNNRLGLLSNVEKFKDIIKINNITILFLTKALFDQIFILDEKIFYKLRYLLVGGEVLTKALIEQLAGSKYKPDNLMNIYGPTENTTFSCIYNIKNTNIKSSHSVPIGVPISNRKTYVLDCNRCLLPIGIVGELYVGGAGVTRGYLKRPRLTQERFVKNPFTTKKDKEKGYTRLYKTGDLVRWLEDGNLEYIGRNDFQVKIRGYRIELAEIESVLSSYPGIKSSTILLREKKENKYLVGYYLAKDKPKKEKIFKYLKKNLPDYMLPSILIELDQLPLNVNGKL